MTKTWTETNEQIINDFLGHPGATLYYWCEGLIAAQLSREEWPRPRLATGKTAVDAILALGRKVPWLSYTLGEEE